ncbi:class I SAM-dependent methyltransferase [Sporomusa termitida]|uniref:BioC: malonyl-acyl carrier protein O-methyltransferase BioC n=1 Tax=Sporomusa termitida TaxID=2377 RepID=A0A517DQ99_9FIRM|nr:class I SAM-dependent methyltransferase [Sporomusa termitida]QDR79531.1 BioC: malonyl-acyl carrier protein O-methyltransferase BioC [Sporomusa termitida]
MKKPALTFNEVASLYHAIRPRYPQELFNDLFRLTSLPQHARILEIGAGTGIATLELIKRGFHVVALEPGAQMASFLKENLKEYKPEVVVSTFEAWTPPKEPFDLVVSFTAFHWLDPQTRYQRIYNILAHKGYLAIVKYHHVAGGDQEFFYEVQKYYQKYKPNDLELKLIEPSKFKPHYQDFYNNALFKESITCNYLTEETYSCAEYEQLLLTYSDHRMLEEKKRLMLLNDIGKLIDQNYGGQIRKCYLHQLIVAGRDKGTGTLSRE